MRTIIKQVIILVLILLGLLMLSTSGLANEIVSDSEESVYASAEVQDAIYGMLQKEWDYAQFLKNENVEILKDSITPVYIASLLDYAESGEFCVNAYVIENDDGHKQAAGNCYIAKLITPDGAYGGNMTFYIEDGCAYGLLYSPVKNGQISSTNVASCSYADHAGRIQNLMNESSFIAVNNVKYVLVKGLGAMFYIENNNEKALVPVGYIYDDKLPTDEQVVSDQVFFVDNRLKEIADAQLEEYKEEYKKYLEGKEIWEKEHPGEMYILLGSGASYQEIKVGVSNINNIINIKEYLRQNGAFDNHIEKDKDSSLLTGILIVLPILFVVGIVCVKKRISSKLD